MDRDWINLPRISAEHENGVEEFIKFAQRYEGRSDDEVKFRCPCVNCLYGVLSRFDISIHIFMIVCLIFFIN